MMDFSDLGFLSVYGFAIAVLIVCMLLLAAVTGTRSARSARRRSLFMPFESGIIPTGSAHLRLPVQYYLIAMFFVIFDVEAAFVFAWATVVTKTGWVGYWSVVTFLAFLALSLAYLWRSGALEWGPHPRQISPNSTIEEQVQ
ncbi:NADH-quinone oxidoreductase subunit A/NADH-ubiquinone/plastoquinone oxidoreductase subunit 3 [Gluconobacter thailandicus F149-1 = NBRC 100600]|uniref:NADH-quinone oxidoreductase subunit A n=1 Tax=Gluconobacter thailandicus NBRC 3257 TaxID=1381097 RepID=A0ABQ0IZJ8_GLUTH|nr:NADH-quinone oxidoreductase subunit A [Gluconobacter thailandicus]KXV53552.1 NADH-quinone oxidoreductase subunit A [Gluconobacter thailandicus]GAC88452.1 NADH-quinone oxidoreductase subunit A [Gluconobacter thailandicus NBRC 3255]GAD27630.1 NADH-quinone oxidoreductase subunit A [Gluconobacter thailandicus NBRC 3257]GAN91972.1 NADH-quinone oxidoreductase subunit A/NADH-ubiquinone/plastoquinone oxidoreductase subunit 3 [Gluconobacter thailandicus F149-1 = NBRC 100600]GEL87726.1 NADH-quinone o